MATLTNGDILQRVADAGITLTHKQQLAYIALTDDLGEVPKGSEVPEGYKRCGKCGHAKKFYLFNKNSSSKTNTSGSCKECQKHTAKKSYKKTKQKRNYKRYYQENKEVKREHARKYYEKNKDKINEKHKVYVQSKKGKKVMAKAHAKRAKALALNKGVPYTRALVIERDGLFQEHNKPVCYLCQKEIEDTSGKGLHLDHVIPVVEGGLDCFTNIACTHALCNLQREKDARELTADQVEAVKNLAEAYMDAYPEKFE
jgi:hypothetical protein